MSFCLQLQCAYLELICALAQNDRDSAEIIASCDIGPAIEQ